MKKAERRALVLMVVSETVALADQTPFSADPIETILAYRELFSRLYQSLKDSNFPTHRAISTWTDKDMARFEEFLLANRDLFNDIRRQVTRGGPIRQIDFSGGLQIRCYLSRHDDVQELARFLSCERKSSQLALSWPKF